ncbi:DUF4124 domain-containing protein [Pseudomonas sp. RIT-PI-AD]|uniref:DUF4124 domain-containing protein n=1 Tax=Pseudomonas sp. RIT-PI-AD TaxID=3035294 RepID=UPI0021D9A82D|nr:DUF4124 domain-containing protein [Pseudomonas sp. RIT-PI-AD]
MRRMILTSSLLLALSGTAMAAQVYKWVDAQGITHFGAQPPEGQETKAISTTVAPPPKGTSPAKPAITAPTTGQPDAEQEAINEKVKQEVAVQEAKRKKFCEDSRTNVAQLQNNPRVREKVDGELRRLTEEERQSRIVELQKSIGENCL